MTPLSRNTRSLPRAYHGLPTRRIRRYSSGANSASAEWLYDMNAS
jgi:hypothetical protein